MSIDDIEEYIEVAEAYRDALLRLYTAMAACNIQEINSLLDSMDALESAVILMMDDFASSGAYDPEASTLSSSRLEKAYPHAERKVKHLILVMQEAREASKELEVFQEEIKDFFQEDMLANTYDVRRKGQA